MAMTLKIGKRASFEVKNLAEASVVYRRYAEETGMGVSSLPEGVVSQGPAKYYVSFNGRVWTTPAKGRNIELDHVRPGCQLYTTEVL